MSKALRLGIMGMSPGNGHPYSWSAIFNGYDATAMETCGFPVIPRYLEQQRFPDDCIDNARVTHVWTHDPDLSRQIAKAACIDSVCDHPDDLIGQVDAVLLARDDAETHLQYATPFLKAGLPIYVDKPLALSLDEAKALINLQIYPGQLFSCSALRYAPELQLDAGQRARIGEIRCVAATVPKDWDKYAVHVIEPMLRLAPGRGRLLKHSRWQNADRIVVHTEFESGIECQVGTYGTLPVPISFRVMGTTGYCDLQFSDTFRAFRATLQDFVDGIRARDVRIAPQEMLDVVEIIELGRSS